MNLTGPSGITVNGANITTDPVNGSVYLDSTSGSVSVSGTSIQAGFLTLYSGDGILLDGTGATFTGSGPYSSVNLTATTFISVNNADFTSYSTVNMASHTINLQNVAFNGTGAGQGDVRRFAPDGTLDRRIELPSLKVTSLMFGGPDLDILYVTTMSMKGFPEDRDSDGSLFAVHGLGIRGLPEHRFGG